MKALYFLTLLLMLYMGEFFIYSGQARWAYPCVIGAIGSALMLINALAESKAKRIVDERNV